MALPRRGKNASPYVASSTLSDRTIEQIIWLFVMGATTREAAIQSGVSKKAIQYYFTLLLKRLIEVKYYVRWHVFDEQLMDLSPDLHEIFISYVFGGLKKHRKNKKAQWKNENMYLDKYASEFMYAYVFNGLRALSSIPRIFEVQYKDILKIIRITGPLNRPLINEEKAARHIGRALFRRWSTDWKAELEEFCETHDVDHVVVQDFIAEKSLDLAVARGDRNAIETKRLRQRRKFLERHTRALASGSLYLPPLILPR